MLSINLAKRAFLFIAPLSLMLFTKVASSIPLYVDTLPQARSNTCQSYSSVLALAAKKDPRFSINTFAELRGMELKFREILEGMNGTPYHHTNWPKAMEQLTSNAYTFELIYEKDITEWMSKVKDSTTLSNSLDGAIAQFTGSGIDTVLTSVTDLNGSSYSGHIVTLLGLVGNGLNSNTQLMVFNSAIKGQGGTATMCSVNNQPGDMLYKAGVVESQNFKLKSFGNSGYVFLKLKAI